MTTTKERLSKKQKRSHEDDENWKINEVSIKWVIVEFATPSKKKKDFHMSIYSVLNELL